MGLVMYEFVCVGFVLWSFLTIVCAFW